MRRIRTSVALFIAAAIAIIGMGTPANAQPHGSLYWCVKIDGHIICAPVAIDWGWEWKCPQCGVLVDYGNDAIINPQVEGDITQHLGNGLQYLGQAALTTDKALQAKLRTEALNQANVAARLTGKSQLRVAQVGSVDRATMRFEPEPAPWLQAAGQDLADAVSLLQSALANPAAADRYRAAAAVQLDEAYNELATQKAIGA
jgi:hypothetical protein